MYFFYYNIGIYSKCKKILIKVFHTQLFLGKRPFSFLFFFFQKDFLFKFFSKILFKIKISPPPFFFEPKNYTKLYKNYTKLYKNYTKLYEINYTKIIRNYTKIIQKLYKNYTKLYKIKVSKIKIFYISIMVQYYCKRCGYTTKHKASF